MSRFRMMIGSVCLLTAVIACIFVPPPLDPGGAGDLSVLVETVLASANFPVALVFAPDGRGFYTEKDTGQVRILDARGQLIDAPFVDLAVVSNSERGLLGIALHPNFEQNGWVYVFYTRSNTGQDTRSDPAAQDNRVVRFTANGNVGADETLIISLPVDPGPNHNGGNIRFGPDGKLYITLGELAVPDDSQLIDRLGGKILRVNDDGTIPDDNPLAAENAIYVLGLRNSFDFAFDPISGMIFATENGANLHDEINRFPAGSNGGWPTFEGSSDGVVGNFALGTYVDPFVEFQGTVVPTGIDFAPDGTFGAASQSQLFVGEFNTGRIIRYTLSADRTSTTGEVMFAQGIVGGITDLAFAPNGTLYVLTTSSILRIVPG